MTELPALTFCAATTVPLPFAAVSTFTAVAVPAVSVRAPKLVVPAVMPKMLDPPDALVMFPLASGVAAVGRILIPDHVSLDRDFGLPPPLSIAFTLLLIVVLVTVEFGVVNVSKAPLPLSSLVTVSVTAELVSN